MQALKSIPGMIECGDEPEQEIVDSAGQEAWKKAYTRKLELSATTRFWAASVADLNACAIAHEARGLTGSDQRDATAPRPAAVGLLDINTEVLGDQSTRLLVVAESCGLTPGRDVFVLRREGGRVSATEVTELGMRDCVGFEFAQKDGETLIIVHTHMYVSFGRWEGAYSLFSIDPTTHHAVPRNLFLDHGKLTNLFSFDDGLFDSDEQWHPPDLIRNGKLSPRFRVYTRIDNKDGDAEPSLKFSVRTYVWNGRHYAPVHFSRRRSRVRHFLRLRRLHCGKALPFRARPGLFFLAAAPPFAKPTASHNPGS